MYKAAPDPDCCVAGLQAVCRERDLLEHRVRQNLRPRSCVRIFGGAEDLPYTDYRPVFLRALKSYAKVSRKPVIGKSRQKRPKSKGCFGSKAVIHDRQLSTHCGHSVCR